MSASSGGIGLPAAPRKRPRRFGPWRRGLQAAVALFYLALPLANAAGWRSVSGTLASLKVGPVDLSEPAAALSAALAARSLPAVLLLGLLPALVLSLALGGVFCSWICPFGFLSEGVAAAVAALRRRRGKPLPGGALLPAGSGRGSGRWPGSSSSRSSSRSSSSRRAARGGSARPSARPGRSPPSSGFLGA